MRIDIIHDVTKRRFKDLEIGDVFMLDPRLDKENVYIKAAETIISKENIKINCFKLKKGLFTFIHNDEVVIVPEEASMSVTI